jgi:hypothetical protein
MVVKNFYRTRKWEMDGLVNGYNLDEFGIVDKELFLTELVLRYSSRKKVHQNLTPIHFLKCLNVVVSKYCKEEISGTELIQLLERIYSSSNGKKFLEMVNRYKDCADDHLEGRMIDHGRGNPA